MSRSTAAVSLESPELETPVTSSKSEKKREWTSPLEGHDSKRFTTSPSIGQSGTLHELMDSKDGDGDDDEDILQASQTQTRSSANITLQKDDLSTIAQLLKESFQKDLTDSLIKPVVDGVLAGLQQQIKILENENRSLKQENNALKVRMERLEFKMDEAEQYSRRNCLRVTGIPERDNEQTDDILMEIGSAIDAPLTKDDIDRSHRVGRKTPGSKSRAIIVKFTSYRARASFYKARTKLKSSGYANVFVNEDLTRLRNSLLFQARQLVRNKTLNGAWSSDGRILVKDRNGKISQIASESDIVSFH